MGNTIMQPSYFPSAEKTAKENGLLQIGTNLFEIGLASSLTKDEMADFMKRLENVCASFHTVFFGNGKEDTRFGYAIGNADFAYADLDSLPEVLKKYPDLIPLCVIEAEYQSEERAVADGYQKVYDGIYAIKTTKGVSYAKIIGY